MKQWLGLSQYSSFHLKTLLFKNPQGFKNLKGLENIA